MRRDPGKVPWEQWQLKDLLGIGTGTDTQAVTRAAGGPDLQLLDGGEPGTHVPIVPKDRVMAALQLL